MLSGILTKLFGKFQNKEEVKKYVLLGLAFGVLIAAYWAMRPIKDGIFFKIVGKNYQPYAKWLSLLVVSCLIIVYSKLVDWFPRHKVFYILTGFYGIAAFVLAYFLAHPTIGIPSEVPDKWRLIGWITYCFIESTATMMVPLFWAFTSDVSTPDSAKRGFPLIMLCAQFGNIVGPLVLSAQRLGFTNSAPIMAIIGALILLVGLIIWYFMKAIPQSQLTGYGAQAAHADVKNEKKPGFFEGLRLIVTQGYLLGIFVFIFVFEVAGTIVDYYMKVEADKVFTSEAAMSNFLSWFAVTTGIVSFLSLLFGVSAIQRRLGMRASLISMPLIMAVGIVVWRVFAGFEGATGLWVSFTVMVAFKALNYAINQPSIKQLYIPTTKDARFKAQAWMEVFAGRGAKAGGSAVNMTAGWFEGWYGAAGLPLFLTVASGASLGMLGIWIMFAVYVAAKYNKAIKENTVVC